MRHLTTTERLLLAVDCHGVLLMSWQHEAGRRLRTHRLVRVDTRLPDGRLVVSLTPSGKALAAKIRGFLNNAG